MKMPVVTRRTALKAIGTAALLPWLSDDALAEFADIQARKAPPKLKVLTQAQYQAVDALVEAIIPRDERSPGASEARVADYIDLLLGEADEPMRSRWLAGLAALDAEAVTRYGAPLVKLSEEQMTALLTDVSRYEAVKPRGDAGLETPRNEQPKPRVDTLWGEVRQPLGRQPLETFFADTKQATIHGYYTSEIGIHQDLRYKGNTLLAEFVGCGTEDGTDCPHCGRKAKA